MRYLARGLSAVALLLCVPATPASAQTAISPWIGINLSGAEFGGPDGSYGSDYWYPSLDTVNYYRARGFGLIRLPVRWEHLQPRLGAALDVAELARLRGFLALVRARGMEVILDVHNGGAYRGKVIGSPEVPIADFADFWKRLALALRGEKAISGWSLMNEPMGLAPGDWQLAAQAATDAIRAVEGGARAIVVDGENWSSAATWRQANEYLSVKDRYNKIYYDAHLYFDHNNSGTSARSFNEERPIGGLDEGAFRMEGFLQWLRAHKAKGFIGEFAWADGDAAWNEVGKRFLAVLRKAGLRGTYWGGGFVDPNYHLSPRAPNGWDGSQMRVLRAAMY